MLDLNPMKRFISDLIESAGGDTVVILEVPPGVGKTRYSIDVSVDMAAGGQSILFFLPTHASALTAFAYAVNEFYTVFRSVRNPKTMPFIIYYEGVNRFCPIYMYRNVFEKAIEYARRRWWITRDEYEKLKTMGPEDAMRVFGWNIICEKVCPIFKSRISFKTERIFVPKSFTELENQIITGEGKVYIRSAVTYLSKLEKKKMVYRLGVYMNFDKGKFSGVCVRVLLNKAVVGYGKWRAQIYFRGCLIISPTSSVDYLVNTVVKRVNAIDKRGTVMPTPVIIIDEYDTYFYRPDHIPVFSSKWVGIERDLAESLINKFKADYAAGRKFDLDVATAAAAALVILDYVIDCSCRLLDNNELGFMHSPASLVFEVAAEELFDEVTLLPVPPLRSRSLILKSPEEFVEDVYKWVSKYVKQNGLFFINPYEVKKKLTYLLNLWEYVITVECRKRGIPYLVPALYSTDGTSFGTGFIQRFDKYISCAKWVYLIRKKGCTNPKTKAVKYVITYKATKVTGVDIMRFENDRVKHVGKEGYVVSIATYDHRWYFLFNQEAMIFMTSATGLPWGSDFFRTRSGVINIFDRFGSTLISYLEGYRFPQPVHWRDRMEYSIEPVDNSNPLKKKILVVSPNIFFLMKYARRGRISAEPMNYLPSKEVSAKDPIALNKALSTYVFRFSHILSDIIYTSSKMKVKYNMAAMLLTQRKDIAVYMTLGLLNMLRGSGKILTELYVCTETKCVKPPKFKGPYVVEMLKFLRELRASHILLKLKFITTRKGVNIYITWFRSKLCRGVDLPDEDVVTHVMVVGSPFRPPSTIDYVIENKPLDQQEIYFKAGRLEIGFHLFNSRTGNWSSTKICIGNTPLDIAESINELIQAYGRGLRKCWRIKGEFNYTVRLFIPSWLQYKFLYYAQLWMKEIFFMEIKLAMSSGRRKRPEKDKTQTASTENNAETPQKAELENKNVEAETQKSG